MSYAIETRDLTYTYADGTSALKGVSFGAEAGKVTGILGGNGAGKSTLFLNLNGVLTPQSGQVLLDGAPVSYARRDLPELRRRVGLVFQDPDDQLFSADVYRDISFGAMNLGLPEAEIRRRVEDAMVRTGVTALRDKPTHALSYGQKKRVAVVGGGPGGLYAAWACARRGHQAVLLGRGSSWAAPCASPPFPPERGRSPQRCGP